MYGELYLFLLLSFFLCRLLSSFVRWGSAEGSRRPGYPDITQCSWGQDKRNLYNSPPLLRSRYHRLCAAYSGLANKIHTPAATGKACLWKHPRAPSVKWLWTGKATEAELGFLRDTRVSRIVTAGRIVTRGKHLEEESGGEEGVEDGP